LAACKRARSEFPARVQPFLGDVFQAGSDVESHLRIAAQA